jgi:hypothetical protein
VNVVAKADAPALRARIEHEMDAAYAQYANELATFYWGGGPGPALPPLTRTERFAYRLGWRWYSARAAMVRGFARLLRVSLPGDDE